MLQSFTEMLATFARIGTVYGLWFFCSTELKNFGVVLAKLCRPPTNTPDPSRNASSKILGLLAGARKIDRSDTAPCASNFTPRLFSKLQNEQISPHTDFFRFRTIVAETILVGPFEV